MALQFIINGIISGLLYSLLALGFALVYNTTRIFHIAAAGIYVFSAYAFYLFSVHFPIIPAFVLSLVVTTGVSLLTNILVYSPLKRKNASKNSLLIASIGVMIVLVNVIGMLFGNMAKVIEHPFPESFGIASFSVSSDQLIQATVSLLALTGMLIFLKFSKMGGVLLAYGDNPQLISVLGLDERKIQVLIFILSGIFISLASNLTVLEVGMLPSIGMPALINAMVAMIIGGMGRYHTCLIGGLLLGLLQSVIMIFTSSTWQLAISFAILLIFLFIRPQGIAGVKTRTV